MLIKRGKRDCESSRFSINSVRPAASYMRKETSNEQHLFFRQTTALFAFSRRIIKKSSRFIGRGKMRFLAEKSLRAIINSPVAARDSRGINHRLWHQPLATELNSNTLISPVPSLSDLFVGRYFLHNSTIRPFPSRRRHQHLPLRSFLSLLPPPFDEPA